jgi:hypothetical protein
MSDPTPERGGRSKRHFRMRAAGIGALKQSRDLHARLWRGVEI